MERRAFLKGGGAAALSAAMAACAPGVLVNQNVRRAPARLYPVQVSWDRIIRITVGLRPFRETGFVLRAERQDDKTIIHNFGHGGAGWSLSWGTGYLAAEIAQEHTDRTAAVIGCGAIGLTTARQLQRRGFDVTIYAKALPPETTSNMSWAAFTPTSGLVTRRTPAWDAQFRRAIEIAYREHQLLAGSDYGVSWIDSYSPTDNPGIRSNSEDSGEEDLEPLLPAAAQTGSVLLREGEHPFQTRYARFSSTLRFEPSIYLPALMRDVVNFGGAIKVRTFDTARDLSELSERLIVNCTGLGAKDLFGDEELMPIKGQLVVLVPQPEVNYSLGGMIPRSDGIALGHVQQRGEWSLEIDYEERNRVMENAFRTFGAMRHPPGPARM